MATVTESEYWKVRPAARRFGVSTYTVRRWISEGKLPAIRVDEPGHLLIPLDAFEQLSGRPISGAAVDVPSAGGASARPCAGDRAAAGEDATPAQPTTKGNA